MREKGTAGYDGRLRRALERGPRPMAVRGLAEEVRRGHRELRGSSYGGVRSYVDGRVLNPRVDLLRAIADVLDVRADWLAFGEGAMTEEEQQAREAIAEVARPKRLRLRKTAETVHEDVLSALARDTAVDPAAWVPPLVRVLHILGSPLLLAAWSVEHDKAVKTTELGAALRGPLDALGVDPRAMSRDALDDYVTAMLPALGLVARESRRQLRTPATDQEDDDA